MDYIDLHTHSIYSDGTSTVKEIIDLCVEKEIKTLSLTDHDSVLGLKEANLLCIENNINFINGIELTADFFGEEIHILAYNFDINNKFLDDFLKKTIIIRDKRNAKILEKLKNIGIEIDVKNLALTENSVITRADISSELISMGYAENNKDAFSKYLEKDKIAYVKKEAFSYIEVLELINKMGAISSLAHPNIYKFYNNNLKTSISELKRHGLKAIECYHSSYNNNVTNTLIGYCNRYNLLQTCGSDFHGKKKKEVFLGQATNSEFVTTDKVSDFLQIVNSNGTTL